MSVKFYLSYDPLKWDFIAFKMNNISRRKRIVDMDVVSDVTCMRQSHNMCGHIIFMNNSDIIMIKSNKKNHLRTKMILFSYQQLC